MIGRKTHLAAISLLGCGVISSWAAANTHTTNGAFDPNEWTLTNSPGSPSASPTISSQTFALDPANDTGGATLYVEQSTNGAGGQHSFGTTLDLMYDYTSSPTVLGASSNATNSAVDVFFQVPGDGDYAIHITDTGFKAFEEPDGAVSPENANGTLDFEDSGGNPVSPWVAFDSTDPDFATADLHTALGFGPSPNSTTPHLIAEFDLTIDSKSSGNPAGGSDGLYNPAPAFWSAAGKSGAVDPPISSEIFTLQPDGSTLTSEALNSLGDPVAQPSDVPEPTSAMLLTGIGGMLLGRRRRA